MTKRRACRAVCAWVFNLMRLCLKHHNLLRKNGLPKREESLSKNGSGRKVCLGRMLISKAFTTATLWNLNTHRGKLSKRIAVMEIDACPHEWAKELLKP